MLILKLKDPNVRHAMYRHPALTGKKMIGRGTFCAVFDNGDTVLKLTCDAKQYAFSCEGLGGTGVYFPTLVKDYGDVSTIDSATPLYLMEMEKLSPIKPNTFLRIKREARSIVKLVQTAYAAAPVLRNMSRADIHKCATVHAMGALSEQDDLPRELREAFNAVGNFCANYDCGHDMQMSNLMLRGEQVVFNDVVADTQSLMREMRKRYAY